MWVISLRPRVLIREDFSMYQNCFITDKSNKASLEVNLTGSCCFYLSTGQLYSGLNSFKNLVVMEYFFIGHFHASMILEKGRIVKCYIAIFHTVPPERKRIVLSFSFTSKSFACMSPEATYCAW